MHEDKFVAFFSQNSFEFADQNDGGPVVILVKSDDSGIVIKLTEGMSYWSLNLTEINYENSKGYWMRKSEENIFVGKILENFRPKNL